MTQHPTGSAAIVSSGMIVREKEPLNLEMPFTGLDGFITPNERFYVRSHNAIPELAGDAWHLAPGA